MKKILVYFLVSLFACVSLNAYAGKKTQNKAIKQEQSENQPSKEETIKFIIETISANHFNLRCIKGMQKLGGCSIGYEMGETYRYVKYQEGNFSMCIDRIYDAPDDDCNEHISFRVDELALNSAISQEAISEGFPQYLLFLYCSSGACIARDENKTDKLYLKFDNEVTKSLAKAFNHLIKLSGGKEKLF